MMAGGGGVGSPFSFLSDVDVDDVNNSFFVVQNGSPRIFVIPENTGPKKFWVGPDLFLVFD